MLLQYKNSNGVYKEGFDIKTGAMVFTLVEENSYEYRNYMDKWDDIKKILKK